MYLLTPAFGARLVTSIFLGDVSWKSHAVGLKQAYWLYVLRVLLGFKVKVGTGFA
jgi:hypothetical protein